jgi:hypothetical protein
MDPYDDDDSNDYDYKAQFNYEINAVGEIVATPKVSNTPWGDFDPPLKWSRNQFLAGDTPMTSPDRSQKRLLLSPDDLLALFCHGNIITLTTEMGVPPDATPVMVEFVEAYDMQKGLRSGQLPRVIQQGGLAASALLTGRGSLQPVEICIRYWTKELDWPDIVKPVLGVGPS